MRNVYEMTHLSIYYKCMEEIIGLNCDLMYKTIFKDNLDLLGNLFVDWVLTVGLSKVPLSFSGLYIENLVLYGWPFVMKFFASFIRELEAKSKDFISKLKRDVKEVTLYNNFNVEHLSEEVRRSISPIKKRKKMRAFRNLFSRKKNKSKQDELDDKQLKTEKRFYFKVKNSSNVLANEDIYLVLKKVIKKFDDKTWHRIFVGHVKCKINRKKMIADLKWTKAQNFAFLT